MSVAAYARRAGVTRRAIQKAIASRRLVDSVVFVDGVPKIRDAALADREFQANTRPRIDHPPPPGPSLADWRAQALRAAASRDCLLEVLAERDVDVREVADEVALRLHDEYPEAATALLDVVAELDG